MEEHRNLYCPHYAECLDVAIHEAWESWTCSRCPLAMADEKPRAEAQGFAHDRREGGWT